MNTNDLRCEDMESGVLKFYVNGQHIIDAPDFSYKPEHGDIFPFVCLLAHCMQSAIRLLILFSADSVTIRATATEPEE